MSSLPPPSSTRSFVTFHSSPDDAPSSASSPQASHVKLPELLDGMTKACVMEWTAQVGDEVKPGDVLVELETDSAIVEFEAQRAGVVSEIHVPANTPDVAVGTVLVTLEPIPGSSSDARSSSTPVSSSSSSSSTPKEYIGNSLAWFGSSAASASAASSAQPVPSPAVAALLRLHNLPVDALEKVTPTGPKSRVLKGDVLAAIADKRLSPNSPPDLSWDKSAAPTSRSGKSAPAAAASAASPSSRLLRNQRNYEDVNLTNMRKTIARRLLESKTTIPHAYASQTCRMDEVMALRAEIKAMLAVSPDENLVMPSLNDFVIQASALSLAKLPELVTTETVDVSVAVSTPTGLITPVIRKADSLGLHGIATEVRRLAALARDGKLQPADYQGGTFSISNLGMFGVNRFSAVINPPQGCILAVGTGEKRIVTSRDLPSLHGVGTFMDVTLSFDESNVDQGLAAEFLHVFKQHMETPTTML